MSVKAHSVLAVIAEGTTRLDDIAQALDAHNSAVVMAVQRLKRRGLVDSEAAGRYVATDAGHALLAQTRSMQAAVGSPRTRTRGLRQRAWWVMRARGVVSLPDLLATLCDGSERDAQSNLGRYLRALVRAQFLVPVPHRPGGRAGHRRYRLVRNNGRQAPVLRQQQGTVFDPNTGELYPIEGARE